MARSRMVNKTPSTRRKQKKRDDFNFMDPEDLDYQPNRKAKAQDECSEPTISMMSDSSEDEEPSRQHLHRVAKKSTTTTATSIPKPYPIRRQAAIKQQNTIHVANRFLENFNPETSVREKRKLNRKINPQGSVRRPLGALYDENGVHLATCVDMCDCLVEDCVGCFFPCSKCGSQKCSLDCRVHRKFIYDQIEYHGYDLVVKNPLAKN